VRRAKKSSARVERGGLRNKLWPWWAGAKLGKKIAWCTAAANKLKWKVYMLVWAVFEPEIVSHGALPLDLPGAYSKI
jgi:hypothetical protein